MKGKVISILVAVVMVLGMVPAGVAMAADDNGDGYSDHDVAKISAFLKLEPDGTTNAQRLGYASADNPAAWTDVDWESDGSELRVAGINWMDKGLAGSLDLSDCTSLFSLSCEGGILGSLDVSGCINLTELYCANNKLVALNVSGCTNLESLVCGLNRFSSIDISACAAIKYFNIYRNPLEHLHANLGGGDVTLDASGGCLNPFYCSGIAGFPDTFIVTAVPVSLPFGSWTGTQDGAPYSSAHLTIELTPGAAYNLTASFASDPIYNDHDLAKMQAFLCDEPLEPGATNADQLGYEVEDPSTWNGVEWDASSADKRITGISWSNPNIAGDLDLSGCSSLATISCSDVEIDLLDVSDCTALTSISWPNSDLHEINARNCTALESFTCTGNYLSMLDLSDCTQLEELSCSGNQLGYISANAGGTSIALSSAGEGYVELAVDTGMISANAAPVSLPFTGWAGTQDGASFTSADAKIDLTPGAAYNLTASFGYGVMYDGNGATEGTAPDSFLDRYAEGGTASVYRNAGGLKRAGYTFTGWNTAANGSGTHYRADGADGLIMPAQDVTLYAEWTPVVYSISYDLDGGAASNPASYTPETPSFILNAPSKAGYKFAGWSGTGVTGTAMAVTVSKGSMGDRSYKAAWTRNAFTVTFDSKGGSAVDSMQRNAGETIASAPSTVRTGYNFTGWYTDAGCTAAVQFPYAPAADITLYAGWTQQAQSNYLANVILSCGTLNRAFNPKVTSYKITIGENDATFTLTPVKQFDGATMTINKKAVPSLTVNPANGKSAKITVKVTYAKKSKTYTFTVARAKSTNNALSMLTASAGAWSQAFDPNVLNYTLTLDENTKSTTIKAAAAAGKLSGVSPASKKITLNNGQSKTLKITVKAQSGARRTYTITVVRAPSTNAGLKSLKASGLIPKFSPGQTNYTVTLPANKNSVSISAKAAGYKAAVYIDGLKKSSKKVTLANGQSAVVRVTVTAQAGNTKEYVITVTRQ